MNIHDWPKRINVNGIAHVYYCGSQGLTVEMNFPNGKKEVVMDKHEVRNLVRMVGNSPSPAADLLRLAAAKFDDVERRENECRETWKKETSGE